MTTELKYPLFSSVLWRLIDGQKLREPSMSSGPLGYRNGAMVDMWMWGKALPPLTRLPTFARLAGIPHEHMLLVWLADTDPKNVDAYKTIATERFGDVIADDLFSGARENSDRPWWGG